MFYHSRQDCYSVVLLARFYCAMHKVNHNFVARNMIPVIILQLSLVCVSVANLKGFKLMLFVRLVESYRYY